MFLVWSTVTSSLVLLLVMSRVPPANCFSLSLNFTVQFQLTSQQPTCGAMGLFGKLPLLDFNFGNNKVKALGILGKVVQKTAEWTDMTKILSQVCQKLFEIQVQFTVEKRLSIGRPTLEADLSCGLKNGVSIGASWEFSVNGHRFLLIGKLGLNWTDNEFGMKMKEIWDTNTDLKQVFQIISLGGCNNWLKKFSAYSMKNDGEEDSVEPTAPPSEEGGTHLQLFICCLSHGNFPRIIFLVIPISSVLTRHLL